MSVESILSASDIIIYSMARYAVKAFCFIAMAFQVGCGNDSSPVPNWNRDKLQLETYNKYASLLHNAYKVGDNYQVALQLANLSGNKSTLNKFLLLAVDETPEVCSTIYKNKYLARQGFYKNIFKYDSVGYNVAYEKCLEISSGQGFNDYVLRQREEEIEYENNRPVLDSSKFNANIIKLLEEIYQDDQRFRVQFSKLLVGDLTRKILMGRQKNIDSINLMRVDSIFSVFGYPTVETVGYDYEWTFFLVLHHQIDKEKREQAYQKYNHYFSEGQKSLFLMRSSKIGGN